MAIQRFDNSMTQAAWSASGQFNLDLTSPARSMTITRLAIVQKTILNVSAPTAFNDPWDRSITQLTLIGKDRPHLNFFNMRPAYHMTRLQLGPSAARRASFPTGTVTQTHWVVYVFHFGVRPYRVQSDGLYDDDPYDLTAGIPPVSTNNLILSGSFAANSAMGTGVTQTDGPIRVFLWGVQGESGDPTDAYHPIGVPYWSHIQSVSSLSLGVVNPLYTGVTTNQLGYAFSIPAGDFLRAALLMQSAGTNSPRVTYNSSTASVINSLQLYSTTEQRELYTVRGFDSASADFGPLEQLSQGRWAGWPPSEDVNGTLGAIAITQVSDGGLFWWPAGIQASTGHPLFGGDLRSAALGDLQLRYGINNATSANLDLVLMKYALNPLHPLNVGA